MGPDKAYKDKIGARIATIIGESLIQGTINQEDAEQIGAYVLENIDKAKNNAELLDFLTNLVSKWSIFDPILTSELQEVTNIKKDEAINETKNLIQQNKIDEALQVAKNATDQQNGGKI